MSVAAGAWAMGLSGLSPTAKFVLIVLADAHNGHTGECFPSLARIAETTGFSVSTVKYAIRDLEAAALISRHVENDPNGRTRGVQYVLSLPEGRGQQVTPRGQMTTGEGSSDEGGRGHMTPPHKDNRKIEPEREPDVARAMRLPADWEASDPFIEFAITEGLTHDETRRLVEPVFRDYWVSLGAQQRGRKSDWLACWRNWVRRDAPRIIRSRKADAGRDGRPSGGILGAYQRGTARVQASNAVSAERADILDL